MKFTVLISKGSDYLIGRIKGLPAVMTQGKSEEEVMENISDALNLYIEDAVGEIEMRDRSDDAVNYGHIISSRELELA